MARNGETPFSDFIGLGDSKASAVRDDGVAVSSNAPESDNVVSTMVDRNVDATNGIALIARSNHSIVMVEDGKTTISFSSGEGVVGLIFTAVGQENAVL